jgi:hypothetical protein
MIMFLRLIHHILERIKRRSVTKLAGFGTNFLPVCQMDTWGKKESGYCLLMIAMVIYGAWSGEY